MDDGVGHADATEQHAEEVEDAGEDHCQVRRHGVGVDHRGHCVGSVMETVDELEAEDEEQGEEQADHDPGIQSAEEIEHEGFLTVWLGARLCQKAT
ncbi:hypothetical protein D3C81_1911680 [compost metagenome]